MSKKKPDIIVWDETRGYYASKLPYGSNLGAPIIRLEDVSAWKAVNIDKANKYFSSKFDELKKEYEELIAEYRWTELIYTAKYAFEPIIGNSYYLYVDDNGNSFLSIISPDEWKGKYEYIGKFALDTNKVWKKI